MGRVPDEHREQANEQTSRVKNFLSDEYFPEERRDQFIFRLKKVGDSPCIVGRTADSHFL